MSIRRFRNEKAALAWLGGIADIDHAQSRGEPRHVEHAVTVDDLAQLMRAKADMIAMVGLGALVEFMGTQDRGFGWVRYIPGPQGRMGAAGIDTALRPFLFGRDRDALS